MGKLKKSIFQEKNLSIIFDELFPLHRSLLGKDYIKSLKILNRYMNLKFYKYKSGKKIFDWKVPKEWIIEGASIKFKKKEILNLKNSNLHVISYSSPINKKFNLSVLKKNLYYLKKKPEYIPYVTSYYKKNWGFCLKYKQFKALKPGVYDCKINSKFKNGFLVNALKR